MVTQYPHSLVVHVVNESVQDDNGNWSDQTDEWVIHSICRVEPNGKGSVINGQDGKAIVYADTVYMPLGTAKHPLCSEALLFTAVDGATKATGKVINFSNGQLNARLWL